MHIRNVALMVALSVAPATIVHATSSIKEIKGVEAYKEIISKKGPQVIVFTSATCTACDSHMKALEDVAASYPQVHFYSFDLSDLPTLRQELHIKYYPTTHFLPNVKKIDRSMTAAEIDDIVYELAHGSKKPEPDTAHATKKSAAHKKTNR